MATISFHDEFDVERNLVGSTRTTPTTAPSLSPSPSPSAVVNALNRRPPVPVYDFKRQQSRLTPLTTYASLVAGGDKTKELLVQRKNASIDEILGKMTKERLQQKLAAAHYSALSTYCLYVPTMAITLFSAILSILLTSEVTSADRFDEYIAFSVAILQVVLSVFQSLGKQLGYSSKAGFHLSAANSIGKILTTVDASREQDRYQSYYKALKTNRKLSIGGNLSELLSLDDSDGNSSSSSDDGSRNTKDNHKATRDSKSKQKTKASDIFVLDPNDQTNNAAAGAMPHDYSPDDEKTSREPSDDSISKQFLQAMDQVDSNVPEKIVSAFNLLESRIDITNRSLLSNKKQSLVAWEKVMPALYFQLTETIIESPMWPIFIPKASVCVEKCLKDFKTTLDVDAKNNADLLMAILDRSQDIGNVNVRLAQSA